MTTGIGWEMGLGGWLWMILRVTIVWALITVVTGRERSAADDPAPILQGRFARGESTRAEHEQARRLLGF